MTPRRIYALIVCLGIVLGSGLAGRAAQTVSIGEGAGFLFRVDGPVHIAQDEILDTVVAVSGDVVIDGRVTEALWVVNGNATVNGQVAGDILIVNGTLHVATGAEVHNVSLVRGELDQAQGAIVTGQIDQRADVVAFGWTAAALTLAIWIGTTLVVVLAGLLFAAVGYRQLVDLTTTLISQPLETLVAALGAWIGLSIVAMVAFVTLIGIPLGIVILLVVFPALWLLGYITAGEALGVWLTARTGRQPRRYLSVTVGLIVLQLISLIPIIGGPVGTIVGLVGAGSIAFRLYRNRLGRPDLVPQVQAATIA